jgi:hypothetical protein
MKTGVQSQWINIVTFVCLLITGGLLFAFMPKQQISEDEKRQLTVFPQLTVPNYLSKLYADSLDKYCSDHFPFRNEFINASFTLNDNRGIKDEEPVIYNVAQAAPDTAQNTTAQNDTSANQVANEYLQSVLVVDKRGIQLFGGSTRAAQSFAQMVNSYQTLYGNTLKIYCLAIPTGADFYLPAKFRNRSNREKPNIDATYNALDVNVIKVDAYNELKQHTNEYLQFNTDHHWTGRGAYYAYRAFCSAAGFQPYELNQFKRGVIKRFLGTLYYLTHNKDLKENIDSVEYFKLPIKTKVSYYLEDNYEKAYASRLFYETAKGGNAYSVFLGGDFPLLKVTSDVKNGRKIIILKDSYGNAFAPYLALHFEEVYVIDYRYFRGDIKKLIKTKGITDLMFAHNTFVVNTHYTVVRERAMLKGIQLAVKTKTDSLQKKAVKDSSNIQNVKD